MLLLLILGKKRRNYTVLRVVWHLSQRQKKSTRPWYFWILEEKALVRLSIVAV